MWDGVRRILAAVGSRGPRKIFCNKKGNYRCQSARMTVPGELVGKKAFPITEEELRELSKHVSSMAALRTFFYVLLNSQKGHKMFNIVGETWNPVTGCPHQCRYCWARQLATTKLRNSHRYREGFVTRFNIEEFRRRFKGGVVFVSDMGDLFAHTVKDEWISRVIDHISRFPDTFFLFLTKNPMRYHEFVKKFPDNAILGATIETDDDDLYLKHRISLAPLPSKRIKAMKELDWDLKFISIEPILDFTERFIEELREIGPFMVYVGYDNYNNKLPEPPLKKTEELISELREFTLVVRKSIRPAWYEGLEKYQVSESPLEV